MVYGYWSVSERTNSLTYSRLASFLTQWNYVDDSLKCRNGCSCFTSSPEPWSLPSINLKAERNHVCWILFHGLETVESVPCFNFTIAVSKLHAYRCLFVRSFIYSDHFHKNWKSNDLFQIDLNHTVHFTKKAQRTRFLLRQFLNNNTSLSFHRVFVDWTSR